MSSFEPLTVAVVDDDEAVRGALSNLLASLDLGVATFASAEEFLA
jgi:FixJ family two-component response regulator